MSVRMKVEKEKECICEICGIEWKNTPEMYTIGFENDETKNIERITLCKDCLDVLFQKTLKATCNYNKKIKQKEDMERIKRNHIWKEKRIEAKNKI